MKKLILVFVFISTLGKGQTAPLQPSAISGPTLVCNGSTHTYSVINDPFATLYSWTLPGGWTGTSTTNIITTTVSNPSGIISVVASNSIGISPTRTLNIASQFTVNTSFTNVSCMGLSNGSANAIPLGGVSPYTYIWLPILAPTQSVINLLPGTYSVYVTDASGCAISKTVSVTQPAGLTSTLINVNSAYCSLPNGSASYSVSGGTAPYSYLWSSNPTFTNSSITGVYAGVYTVTATDANGCAISKTVSITQPAVLNSTIVNVTNTNCSLPNGSASLSVSGGTGPYSYQWSSNPTFTNSSITGVYAGAYTVTVTDANGCTSLGIASINNIAGPSINTLTSTSITCNGLSNGTASISTSGGSGTLTYLWSYLSQITSSVNNLPAGNHTITVTDGTLCATSATFNTSQPPAITVTAVANNSVVCAGNSSTLTASAAGGIGSITYTWNTGGMSSIEVVNPIISTIYTINVTDANLCLKTNTVSVLTNSLPVITTSSSGSLTCTNSVVSVFASTGSGLLYSWNGFGIVSGATSPTAVVNAPGVYSVTVTSSVNGCSVAETVTVNLNNAIPVILVSSSSSLICSGQSATLTANGASSYSWSSGSASAIEIVSPTVTTNYIVNGTAANGCTSSAFITQSVSLCTGFVKLSGVEAKNVNVFPNPNNGFFDVHISTTLNVTESNEIQILNTLGQVVYESIITNQKVSINIHQLSNGIYFVKVLEGYKVIATQKIIKE